MGNGLQKKSLKNNSFLLQKEALLVLKTAGLYYFF